MDDIETRKMREAIYAKAHTMICDAFHDAGCAIPDPDHDADVNQLNAALGNLEQSITAALIEAADTIRSLRDALHRINTANDNPARFSSEIQAILDGVIDTSDHVFAKAKGVTDA